MTKYDCVYYWVGGTEHGKWKQADAGTRDSVRKMGYVAFDGNSQIGPPDGPPSKDELDLVLVRAR